MEFKRVIFYCSIVLLFGSHLFGQSAKQFKHFTVENGLSQGTVNRLKFDNQGYLWIATEDGLNRFDGKTFDVFRHDPHNPNSLPDSKIVDIWVNNDKTLWLITEGHLVLFNWAADSVQHISADFSTANKREVLTVTSKYLDYFDKNDGIVRYFFDSKKCQLVDNMLFPNQQLNSKTPINYVRQFAKINNQYWLFLKPKGALMVDSNLHLVDSLFLDIDEPLFGAIQLPTNDYWIYSETTLYQFDPSLTLVSSHAIPKGFHMTDFNSVGYHNERIWISSYGYGILEFNITQSHFTQYIFEPSNSNSLAYNFIICMELDAFGNLWVGTNSKGFDGLASHSQLFHNITTQPSNKSATTLTSDFVRSIYISSDSLLYVGFNDLGLDKINLRTGNKSNHQFSDRLYDNTVLSIQPTYDSTSLLLGTYQFNVLQWKDDKFFKLFDDSRYTGITATNGLCYLNDTTLLHLVSHTTYVSTIKPSQQLSNSYYITKEVGNRVFDIVRVKDRVYLLSEKGLSEVVEEEGKFHTEEYLPLEKTVKCFEQANDTLQFIGTTAGLYTYNPISKAKTLWTTADGLPNNHIYGVLNGDENCVWISTNYGLSHFRYDIHKFENYSTEDGLPANEFNTGAFYKHTDGTLYFGSMGGVTSLRCNHAINQVVGSPLISKIWVNDLPYSLSDNSILLSPEENTIGFELSTTDLLRQSNYNYQFQLTDIDDNWLTLGNDGKVRYPQLAPGKYTFHYRNGVNNQWGKTHQLTFVIAPPFWKTAWFIASISLLTICFIVLIIRYIARYQLRKEIAELKTQQKLEADRNRISRELHDNVGSHLSILINHIEAAESYLTRGDTGQSLSTINTAYGQSKHIIEQLRETIWALKKTRITFDEFLSRLKIYYNTFFRHSATKPVIASSIYSDKTLNPLVSLTLFRIFQEAAHNCIKYADATTFTIDCSYNMGKYEFLIKDNGKGFLTTEKSVGEGLNNMQIRADEIGAELIIQSTVGKGTTITLTIAQKDCS